MPRTPEQIAADDALTAAIEAVQRAYDDELQGVLTGYVVLAKRRYWDESGDGYTAVTSIAKDSAMPVDEQLGLVEYASTLYRAEIIEPGD
ncbi:hypothetical protein IU454_08060 [Nocardia farcinica]|uniref:hypothetical protein n=1 Tax=Nocardia farcinica TaxID=37329 RepID=UPI0018945CE4|nr:hypothetical protein [Nocardia farcinica]MBF6291817.1 hypothetical protein [Nocardia farcinica]